MRTLFITGLVLCTMASITGCQTTAEGGIPEGSCFPQGDQGEDFTEADLFCQDTFCPDVGCDGRIVAEALCSRSLAITGYHQCICDCCDPQIAVGGTGAQPEVWEEVYTCVLDFGEPPCEQDTRVRLELVQTGACGQTIEWTIAPGFIGEGNQYSGTLDNGSFRWESVGGTDTPEEQGCWQFDGDGQMFNKLSTGSGFDCIGRGTRGQDSDPGTTATCNEIVAAEIDDFGACPPAPPDSLID
jgi:hypothetical protein